MKPEMDAFNIFDVHYGNISLILFNFPPLFWNDEKIFFLTNTNFPVIELIWKFV